MTEITERLKSALAPPYTIERELGSGGATVYLAEHFKLHRQVALRVLRLALAAAAGPERFVYDTWARCETMVKRRFCRERLR